ncbi:MAG: zinc ribbon domain-containing protein [Clostridia bacterium]|nr:zinc ribbon domain-containing protein [Clostridia bacterium]
MFCSKCGKQLESNEKFCSRCGTAVQSNAEKRFCAKCGNELGKDERYCSRCGTDFNDAIQHQVGAQNPKSENLPSSNAVFGYFLEYKKCLSAFIVGLIGSIFGMFGGICTSMCSCFSSSASGSAFLFIFGGAVIGLIGSCMCLNKARIGSVLQLIGTLMIIIRAFALGAEFFTIFSFLILLTASGISLVSAHLLDFLKKR